VGEGLAKAEFEAYGRTGGALAAAFAGGAGWAAAGAPGKGTEDEGGGRTEGAVAAAFASEAAVGAAGAIEEKCKVTGGLTDEAEAEGVTGGVIEGASDVGLTGAAAGATTEAATATEGVAERMAEEYAVPEVTAGVDTVEGALEEGFTEGARGAAEDTGRPEGSGVLPATCDAAGATEVEEREAEEDNAASDDVKGTVEETTDRVPDPAGRGAMTAGCLAVLPATIGSGAEEYVAPDVEDDERGGTGGGIAAEAGFARGAVGAVTGRIEEEGANAAVFGGAGGAIAGRGTAGGAGFASDGAVFDGGGGAA
jgi:hypothetical protein